MLHELANVGRIDRGLTLVDVASGLLAPARILRSIHATARYICEPQVLGLTHGLFDGVRRGRRNGVRNAGVIGILRESI